MTRQQVDGHAFHDGFAKGRASGQILIDASAVRFTNDSASVALPLSGVKARLGGASDRLVFFEHPDYPDWQLYTADRSVLKNPHFQQHKSLSRQVAGARRLRIFNWSVLGSVVGLIIAVPLLLVLYMDTVTGWIAPTLPAEWEESLGESALAQYKIGQSMIESEAINESLDALVAPLLKHADNDRYEFHVYIANDAELNAFALPGGYIVLNSGLLQRAESADEVLGVLAHEIAHVTEQHGVRQVMARAGLVLTVQALVGDVNGIMAMIAAATPALLSQSYSRGFETAADEHGFALLEEANINPNGLVSFFEKIIEEEQARLEEIEDEDSKAVMENIMPLLSSHPATQERIENMQDMIAGSDGRYLTLEKEFLALQQQVREAVAAMPRDDNDDMEKDDLNEDTERNSGES